MQKLFDEVGSLDKRCYEKFALSEDILMEHAAEGMSKYIRSHFALQSKVLIVCGSGNNGADGIALARLLHADFKVELYLAKAPRSEMALLQAKRSKNIGVKKSTKLKKCDVLVDAYLGTGFHGSFDNESKELLQKMNALKAFKIACDVPSGLQKDGQVQEDTFRADITLTMGTLKKSLFLDAAKDYVGAIEVINLGLSRSVYETSTQWLLLDREDLVLPLRAVKNTHKGNYGHLALIAGEKKGATLMSAKAALKFGVGLVTLVSFRDDAIPDSLMSSHTLPKNTTALALGMGLGNAFSQKELAQFLNNSLPIIADADIFYMEEIVTILERKNGVLTPHPKEFVSLLKMTNLADITIEELQNRRFKYVELFCKNYPNITLLLKGANVIIAQQKSFFINPHGSSALAKGGSGDVLSGLIAALLAQGYISLDAAIHASLAHTELAKNYSGADFSLTPEDLIQGIGNL